MMERPVMFSLKGIVDAIKAERKGDEVKYLKATVRIETEFEPAYYSSSGVQIDEISISLSPSSPVNPGDLVSIDIAIVSPFTPRFVPALEAGSVSDDERASGIYEPLPLLSPITAADLEADDE